MCWGWAGVCVLLMWASGFVSETASHSAVLVTAEQCLHSLKASPLSHSAPEVYKEFGTQQRAEP